MMKYCQQSENNKSKEMNMILVAYAGLEACNNTPGGPLTPYLLRYQLFIN